MREIIGPDPEEERERRERDYQEYRKSDTVKGSDKQDHAERSRHNDTGQHDQHWAKEGNKK